MIYHYYHLYADGEFWQEAFTDHVKALKQAKIPDMKTTICILGNEENTKKAHDAVVESGIQADIVNVFGEWEHPTLNLIAEKAKWVNEGDLFLYAHTKGAVNKCNTHTEWRRIMEVENVIRWKNALRLFEVGCDTVGCYYLTNDEFPNIPIKYPYYAGNFWWAKASHIRKLEYPVSLESRYEAECWIGSSKPNKAGVLRPGFPI